METESQTVCLKSYQDNPGKLYKTFIPPIKFDGSYKVAVKDVFFLRSWVNVPKPIKIHVIKFDYATGQGTVLSDDKAILEPAEYPTFADFETAINKVIHNNFKNKAPNSPIITASGRSFKVICGLDEANIYFPFFDDEMYKYLNVSKTAYMEALSNKVKDLKTITPKAIVTSVDFNKNGKAFDPNARMHTLDLKCNFVESKILASVPVVRNQYLNENLFTFSSPIFQSVTVNLFDSLNITFTNDAGEEILFGSGQALVTLLFKKAKPQEKQSKMAFETDPRDLFIQHVLNNKLRKSTIVQKNKQIEKIFPIPEDQIETSYVEGMEISQSENTANNVKESTTKTPAKQQSELAKSSLVEDMEITQSESSLVENMEITQSETTLVENMEITQTNVISSNVEDVKTSSNDPVNRNEKSNVEENKT